jgi:maltooligosyltrehalose trehalohydrolase
MTTHESIPPAQSTHSDHSDHSDSASTDSRPSHVESASEGVGNIALLDETAVADANATTFGGLYEAQFGARLLSPTRTRFRLWAPSVRQVGVIIDECLPQLMQAQGDGWFELDADCGAGAAYSFCFPDSEIEDLFVPDPASRLQQHDVHGPSIVCDSASYTWRCTEWRGRPWQETILYELHVGAFGGFKGVKKNLAQLAKLGITAVELMPIADFPGARNWGYDGVLPYAQDRAYGSPEELKDLIDSAHALGMMVFLDVVYNHFGPDGNYIGAYAKPFFRDDIHTPWGSAIDFRVPQVVDFFTENAIYWLNEFRFDGLRFDAVHAIAEQSVLPTIAERIRAAVDPQRQIHLVLENEGNTSHLLKQGYDAQWNDDGHNVLHVLLSGETHSYYRDYAQHSAEKLACCLSQGFCYQGQISLVTGDERGEPTSDLSPDAFVLFLQNHDQVGNRAMGERLTHLAPAPALHAAQALLLLCPQIPMLFMGEEDGVLTPFFYFTDHQNTELAEAVRTGRHEEFSYLPAFASAEQRATLPDPNAPTSFTGSIPQVHTESPLWRTSIQRLIELRHEHIIPRLTNARALGAIVIGKAAVRSSWRMQDDTILSIAINLDKDRINLSREFFALGGRYCDGDGDTVLMDLGQSVVSIGRKQFPGYGFLAVLHTDPTYPADCPVPVSGEE